MRNILSIPTLRDIYLVANTPTYLFRNFTEDEGIRDLANHYFTEQLISEFGKLAAAEINDVDSLVYAYALYVAIILKDDDDTYKFFTSKDGTVKYEWFKDLRDIYISRLTLPTTSFIEIEAQKYPQKVNEVVMGNDNVYTQEIEFA